jgi:hypothetical protein
MHEALITQLVEKRGNARNSFTSPSSRWINGKLGGRKDSEKHLIFLYR